MVYPLWPVGAECGPWRSVWEHRLCDWSLLSPVQIPCRHRLHWWVCGPITHRYLVWWRWIWFSVCWFCGSLSFKCAEISVLMMKLALGSTGLFERLFLNFNLWSCKMLTEDLSSLALISLFWCFDEHFIKCLISSILKQTRLTSGIDIWPFCLPGKVFLDFKVELEEVYKIYCQNHDDAISLLESYEKDEIIHKHVLECLEKLR